MVRRWALVLAAGCLAAAALAQGGAVELFRPAQYWEAEAAAGFARQLSELGVTAQQIAPALPALQAYQAAARQEYAASYDAERARAFLELAQRLLLGQRVSDEDWNAARQVGQGNLEEAQKKAREARTAAAKALLSTLAEKQIRELGKSPENQTAEAVMRTLQTARALPPDEWGKWVQQSVKQLVDGFSRTAGQELGQSLQQFFQQVRNMPTDQFYREYQQLQGQLAGLLRGGKTETLEQIKQRALHRLAERLNNPVIAALLVWWAQQGQAGGQQ